MGDVGGDDGAYRGINFRIDALRSHHDERLEETIAACNRPSSAAEVMKILFTREPDLHQTRFAVGETLAHLHMLIEDGQITRELAENGTYRYGRAA